MIDLPVDLPINPCIATVAWTTPFPRKPFVTLASSVTNGAWYLGHLIEALVLLVILHFQCVQVLE
jgi:hypothetical protein